MAKLTVNSLPQVSKAEDVEMVSMDDLGEGLVRVVVRFCGKDFKRLSSKYGHHAPIWHEGSGIMCTIVNQETGAKLEAIFQTYCVLDEQIVKPKTSFFK